MRYPTALRRLLGIGISVAVLTAMALFASVPTASVHASPALPRAMSSSAYPQVSRIMLTSGTGPGTYTTSSGYWHSQLTVSYSVDAGVVTWYVTPKCWVNSDVFYDPFGVEYVLDCSLMYNPHPGNSSTWQMVTWHTTQVTQPDGVFPTVAAQLNFGTYGSAYNVEWSMQVISTESAIRALESGDYWLTLSTPPSNDVETLATT